MQYPFIAHFFTPSRLLTNTYIAKKRCKSPLVLMFAFRLNVRESNPEKKNLELYATLRKGNKYTVCVVCFVGYLMTQLHRIRWEDQEHYVGRDLKQTAFDYLKVNSMVFIWRPRKSWISQNIQNPGHIPMKK